LVARVPESAPGAFPVACQIAPAVAVVAPRLCVAVVLIDRPYKKRKCNDLKSISRRDILAHMLLYNTATKKKERFIPRKKSRVGLYTCGPTVYDIAHLGNLRTYIFEDVLRRVFVRAGYDVHHVMNITDVGHLSGDSDDGEDKMTNALQKEGKTMTLRSMRALGRRYTKEFLRDIAALNILAPHDLPRASDHVEGMVDLIARLEKSGFAYKTSDGVYFDTAKDPHYGALAGLRNVEQRSGARIAVKSGKRNAADFALWKFNPMLGWAAPWGKGFPGWHIECSSMSMQYLGEQFDVHTGGIDHIPLHHTNEIAQSENATGKKPWVKYWLHGEFLVLGRDMRMGKSEGNALTLRAVVDRGIDPLAYRYFVLMAHYRRPLTFTWKALQGAASGLDHLRVLIAAIDTAPAPLPAKIKKQFNSFFDDDLDTAGALAFLWEVLKSKRTDGVKHAAIAHADAVFGLDLLKKKIVVVPKHVQTLVKKRDTARANKDWKQSDMIRGTLESKGWIVEDTPKGTRAIKKTAGG
jgi:cysteinyl-tRNA synthetase